MNDIANSLIKKLGHKTSVWLTTPDEFISKCRCCDGKFKFSKYGQADQSYWSLYYEIEKLSYFLIGYNLKTHKDLDFFYCPKVQALL